MNGVKYALEGAFSDLQRLGLLCGLNLFCFMFAHELEKQLDKHEFPNFPALHCPPLGSSLTTLSLGLMKAN